MSQNAGIYYRTYTRALRSYVNSGFFSRDLDADDVAFIERIRERGAVPCGSLAHPAPTACTYSDDVIPRTALIEEMEFWHQPYRVDHGVTRRLGPVIRPPARSSGSTPEAERRRQNREAMAAAVAEQERLAEERAREQKRRDEEWEKAAPPKRIFGRVVRRHYFPQWKIDEKKRLCDGERQKAMRRAAKLIKQRLIHAARIQAESEAAGAAAVEAQRAAAEAARRQHDEVLQRKHDWEARYVDVLKTRIMKALQMSAPRLCTVEELMAVTGCNDPKFLIRCADELMREGRVRRAA
jgi:hypothetical protein